MLRTCVEGFLKDSDIFERLVSSIELNVLSMLLMPGEDDARDVLEFGFTTLEQKYMSFLYFLEKPAYLEGVHESCIIKSQECIHFVEVKWHGSTHRLFFHKPKILEALSKTYLDVLYEIDGASQEDKLNSLLSAVKALYTEAKHQQQLEHYGLSYLWSQRLYLSWLIFAVGSAINILLLHYYYRDEHNTLRIGYTDFDDDGVANEVQSAIQGLIVVHIVVTLIMSILFITVRMPANYKSKMQTGHTFAESLLYSIADPIPWWYLLQVAFSVLGYLYDPIFCVIIMLEWVLLNNTTRNLLKAVYYPLRQLFATLMMLVITIHIFSGMYFSIFSHDVQANHVGKIAELFDSLKLALSYGLRGEYGVDHELHPTLGSRMILDLAFYFVVIAILRHIFFAIIVETFGQLREMNNERTEKLHNSCFMCGIVRHDFEKAGLATSFHHHRETVHSVENYVGFIFAILEQPPHEDLGIEMHIRRCIDNMDISWIPIGLESFYGAIRQNRAKENKNIKAAESLTLARVPSGGHPTLTAQPSSNAERATEDTALVQMPSKAGQSEGSDDISELVQAVQNIASQLSAMTARLDSIENLSREPGVRQAGDTPAAMLAPIKRTKNALSRVQEPVARLQLQGPSEAALLAQLPSFGSPNIRAASPLGLRGATGSSSRDNTSYVDDETKYIND